MVSIWYNQTQPRLNRHLRGPILLNRMKPDKPFTHLHTHSHYSLLDGLSKIPALVKKAKADGMTALALTDHGALYGAIEFYKECTKAGIKPIIGVEAYMAERSRLDKDAGLDSKRYHLTLLARNVAGYKNLMKLVTRANLEGYYYKPRMDEEILREHADGIICLSGCPGSRFIHHVKNGNIDDAKKLLSFYIEIFGKEHVFVEVMKHNEIDWYVPLIPKIITIAKELDLPLVGTWDAHYLHTDDAEAQDTLVAINTGSEVGNAKMSMKAGNYSFIGSKEAWDVFKDIPGAYENTSKVADLVDIKLELGVWTFPNFPIESGRNQDDELRALAYEGIAWRELEKTQEIVDRLEYELEIIKNKGFSIYLLIVADLLRYARENSILTNIRGSVAGSITTYLLGITTVNPLEYELPFERFLNPERPSAPDIDMDYADNRRDDVLDYVRKKYGEDKVAQIGTFGTMMARGAVRDVARALGYPYMTGDRISKLIPMGSQGFPMTIDLAMEMVPEIKEMYGAERDVKTILDMARKIEGCARHISVHAAGVVISPTALWDFVPTQLDPKGGKIITQYDMHAVEEAGLIKFDFLGIRNLAILGDAIRLVKEIFDVDIDIDKIPLNDRKTFAILARGETMGLFQLNGSGMTKYLKDLKPTTIHDINAMVALYRPGPLEMIPEYIKRKHNPMLIKYLDPRLKPILKNSFGVITYQDDVMMIAIKLAGYSWLEADKLRKAMGKKIPAEMEAQKEKLFTGFVKNGMNEKMATEFWKLIEPFAAYGFNKAHAASYGRVAYQTAYMKANYPVEYMTAILTAESGDVEKIAEIIHECKAMKIIVLPPDVNASYGGFTVIKNSKDTGGGVIRFGLYTVKNLGTDIADAIIAERKAKGSFLSLGNFLERITHKNLNKKSLEALVKCGAFDEFGERGNMLANTERLLEFNKENRATNTQDSLFSTSPTLLNHTLRLEDSPKATKEESLIWEKELLGLYISGHPLDRLKDKLAKLEYSIKTIHERGANEKAVILAGIIEDVRIVTTKKNERMAFIRFADLTGSIETVIFPKLFTQINKILVPDTIVAIKGKISIRNGERTIVCDNIKVTGIESNTPTPITD